MNPTKALHDLGQSLWLDNITRNLLDSGTLQRYIDGFSVTGLTSNPTIFDHAIKNSADYDRDISWDVAASGEVPGELTNRLGVAIAKRTYKAYREFLASGRVQRTLNAGARAQRLLWASTGTKDPTAPDTLYVKALAAPFTVNTMPEGTLKAFGDHGEVRDILAPDGGDCEVVLAAFAKAGIDVDALAARLQDEGTSSFVTSWNDLMARIEAKSAVMRKAG
jgi:transaldolase